MIRFRPDAAHDIANAIAMINEPLQKCCWTCCFSIRAKSYCNKYNATPPMEVITFGCPAWTDRDEIPF